MSLEEVERKTLLLLGIPPSQQLLGEIGDLEFKQYTWVVRAGVRLVLNELVGRYRLGIISNSVSNAVLRGPSKGRAPSLLRLRSPLMGCGLPETRPSHLHACLGWTSCQGAGGRVRRRQVRAGRPRGEGSWNEDDMASQQDERADSYFDGVAEDITFVPGLIAKIDSDGGGTVRMEKLVQAKQPHVMR